VTMGFFFASHAWPCTQYDLLTRCPRCSLCVSDFLLFLSFFLCLLLLPYACMSFVSRYVCKSVLCVHFSTFQSALRVSVSLSEAVRLPTTQSRNQICPRIKTTKPHTMQTCGFQRRNQGLKCGTQGLQRWYEEGEGSMGGGAREAARGSEGP